METDAMSFKIWMITVSLSDCIVILTLADVWILLVSHWALPGMFVK